MPKPPPAPDIQKQLHYHMQAQKAAERGRKAEEEGKIDEARKAQLIAERFYQMYLKYGGKGPLT